MNKEQAIKVLCQVAHLAQKGGLLSLQDAPVVATAVSMLEEKEEQVKPEVEANTSAPKTPKKSK